MFLYLPRSFFSPKHLEADLAKLAKVRLKFQALP
jgi:hypothetical protein